MFKHDNINWQKITPYLFLLPAIAILTITIFFPAIQAFALSFTQYEYDLTQTPEWVGFVNFQRLWGDRVFWQTVGNTLLYLVGAVPFLVIIPLILAILVNQTLPGIYWFRTAFLYPCSDLDGSSRDCLESTLHQQRYFQPIFATDWF